MFEVFQWSVRVKLGQERISITLPQCQYQRLLSLLPLIICTIIIIIIIIKIYGCVSTNSTQQCNQDIDYLVPNPSTCRQYFRVLDSILVSQR